MVVIEYYLHYTRLRDKIPYLEAQLGRKFWEKLELGLLESSGRFTSGERRRRGGRICHFRRVSKANECSRRFGRVEEWKRLSCGGLR
jgi:hypothetical protein